MSPTTISLILGQPRSGGNLVAGVLHRLGVSMGASFRPGNDWNAEWYEDLEFDAIIRRLMGADPAPVKVSGPQRTLPHDVELAALVAARQSAGKPWGVKNIHLPLAIDQLVSLCGDSLRPILTTRDLDLSVESYAARAGMGWDAAKTAVVDPLLAALRAMRQYRLAALRVDYDSLLADPTGQVKRIADHVGVPVNPDALAWVQPALRRFGGPTA